MFQPSHRAWWTRRLIVPAVLGLSFIPGKLQAQGSVVLELRGAPGEWMRYVHRNDLVVELPDDFGGPSITRTSIRLLNRVEEVSPQTIGYATILEEVSLEVRPPPPELPDLSGIQGLEFSHTSDLSGRTLSLRLPGQDVEAGPGLMGQVQNWLGQLGFPLLPKGAVSVGDVWTETVPVPAMALGLAVDYEVVQTRSVRLTEVRTTRTSRVAFLEVVTSWEPAPEPGGTGGGVASLRGTAEQVVRFDIGKGRFLGSTGTSDLEIVLTPPDAAQYVAVRAEGRQLTGLSASSDD